MTIVPHNRNRVITVVFSDRNGQEIEKREHRTNSFGSFSGNASPHLGIGSLAGCASKHETLQVEVHGSTLRSTKDLSFRFR